MEIFAMKFTRYMDAAAHCIKRGIDLSRIVRKGLYEFRIARAA
jgi:hypothetical protein